MVIMRDEEIARGLVRIAKELTAVSRIATDLDEITKDLNTLRTNLKQPGGDPQHRKRILKKLKGIRQQTKALLKQETR
jgi:hypothetical protein